MALNEIIASIDGFFSWLCTNTHFFTPGLCWFFLISFSLIIGGMILLCILGELLGLDTAGTENYSCGTDEEIPIEILNADMCRRHPPGTKDGWRDPNNPDHWNLEQFNN